MPSPMLRNTRPTPTAAGSKSMHLKLAGLVFHYWSWGLTGTSLFRGSPGLAGVQNSRFTTPHHGCHGMSFAISRSRASSRARRASHGHSQPSPINLNPNCFLGVSLNQNGIYIFGSKSLLQPRTMNNSFSTLFSPSCLYHFKLPRQHPAAWLLGRGTLLGTRAEPTSTDSRPVRPTELRDGMLAKRHVVQGGGQQR